MTRNMERRSVGSLGGAGFTLIEVIVALGVLSIAATVYISFFNSSVGLSQSARDLRVAGKLAEEQLAAIQNHPEHFFWNLPDQRDESVVAVGLGPDDPPAGNPCSPPALMPVEADALRREQAVYDGFRWKAFARFPDLQPGYCEVTMVIAWEEGGDEKAFTLTSALALAWDEALALPNTPAARGGEDAS